MVTLFNYLNSPTYNSMWVCMCVSVCICGCVRGYVGVHMCVEEYGTLFSLSTPQGKSG